MFNETHSMELNLNTIIEDITKFLETKDNIACAYIFGSFGTEDFTSQSDIDIAVLPTNELSYSECLKLNSELEDIINLPIDLNNILSLPEYIQVQIIMRNTQLFCKDYIAEDKYINKLNHWIKTEFPFWKKVMNQI